MESLISRQLHKIPFIKTDNNASSRQYNINRIQSTFCWLQNKEYFFSDWTTKKKERYFSFQKYCLPYTHTYHTGNKTRTDSATFMCPCAHFTESTWASIKSKTLSFPALHSRVPCIAMPQRERKRSNTSKKNRHCKKYPTQLDALLTEFPDRMTFL